MNARPDMASDARAGLRSLAALVAGVAAAVAMCLGVWSLLRAESEGPATAIHVEGAFARVTAEEISATVRPLLEESFGALDLAQIRRQIERLPWIARARVERRWPATVRIRVWERKAAARWGEQAMLDSEARVFHPPSWDIDPALPLLHAPPGHEREILDAYSGLHTELAGNVFEPVALNMDSRGEWLARSAQGVEMRLGRQPPPSRAALIRGVLTRSLETNLALVRYVDLRYTNGFSVGWITPPAAAPAKDGGTGNG